MIDLDYPRVMARYNRWMNERLYALVADLPDAERRRDRGAFFRSIHGTLDHLLLADRIWLGRFTGAPVRFASLDEKICADFATLRRERERTDDDIDAWVASLSADRLAGTLRYRSVVNPQDRELPCALAVMHFFNHQTHHRGQLTTLLSQAGIDPGVTDLVWLPGAHASG